jgi:hypothetical protein
VEEYTDNNSYEKERERERNRAVKSNQMSRQRGIGEEHRDRQSDRQIKNDRQAEREKLKKIKSSVMQSCSHLGDNFGASQTVSRIVF